MYLDATDLDAPCQDCDSSAALQWGTQNAVGRSMTEQLPGGCKDLILRVSALCLRSQHTHCFNDTFEHSITC